MSIQSKARRDAHRKKAARQRVVTGTPRPAIEAHAELRGEDGTLLGGIARREDEWELGLDGKMVGGSTSAATILTMIKRAATMHERAGTRVVLNFSDALRDAANEEVRVQGLSLEQFEARLDDDMTGSRPVAASGQSGSTTGTASGP